MDDLERDEGLSRTLVAYAEVREDFEAVSAAMLRIHEYGRTKEVQGPFFDALVHVSLHQIVCQRMLACFPSDVVGCEVLMRITRSFIKYKATDDVIFAGIERWFGRPVGR